MSLLAGKVALVTGGGSGIGRAVCQLFAKNGARVMVADINHKGAEETANLLSDKVHSWSSLDVASSASVSSLMTEVMSKFNQPASIVANCAGITVDNFLLKLEEEEFDRVIDVNLKGTYLVTKAAAASMKEAAVADGSIVNIASIVGKAGNIGQCNYTASKAGVEGFTRSAAKELARYNIRVNSVLPGYIDTPMVSHVPDNIVAMVNFATALKRTGRPEEVAQVVMFLASPLSSYVTGASYEVTGGLSM